MRHAWAVSLLDLTPDLRVLEVGCGTGAAAALLVAALRPGRYVGVDRSATAVAAAAKRVPAATFHRATFHGASLAELDLDDRFDRIVAVNVNAFWTGPASVELATVRRLLVPTGRLVLVYELPGPDERGLGGMLVAHLEAAGFVAEPRPAPARTLIGVVARP